MPFIAGVINDMAEVRSKTERIQIIVKAAIHRLDMRIKVGRRGMNSVYSRVERQHVWVNHFSNANPSMECKKLDRKWARF